MKKLTINIIITFFLVTLIASCSSPAEKAEKYYQKGMSLLEKDPAKAKLEFQNALQMKKNMTKAVYSLGLVAERQGDWKGAFSYMRQVNEKEPNNIEAIIKLGEIFLAAGKLDLAEEKSKKALEIDKTNVAALNLYAMVQLKSDNKAAALEYAKLALARDPKNQNTFVILAEISLKNKDNKKAIEYFDKALSFNEKNITIQFLKAKTFQDAAMPAEAEQTYQAMIKLFPNNVIVKRSYVQFLIKSNRRNDAEQQLRMIALANPDDVNSKLDVVKFIFLSKGADAARAELEAYVKKEPKNYDLSFALVDLYRSQKNLTEVDNLLNQIVKQAGKSAPSYKAQNLIAYQFIGQGKNAEASKLLNEILAEDKSNSLALTLRANLALQAKNYDAAVSDLREVLRDSPDSSNAALMLANAYENTGSAELAEENYLKAFQTSKLSSQYGVPYTQFLLRRKQPDRAEKILEDILSAHPNDLLAIRVLAQLKIQKKDYAGAQALAEKVKGLNTQNTLNDEILGAISSSKNNLEGTLTAYKSAHLKSPDDIGPINAIVNAYVKAGKLSEALTFMQATVKAKPDNAETKLILGQLLASSGMTQSSIDAFNAAIKLNPKLLASYQRLALAQVSLKQNAEAKKSIELGLKVAPDDFGLNITEASIYEATGQFDNAIKVYEKLNLAHPDSAIVANNLASLLLDNRNDKISYERAYALVSKVKTSELAQFIDTLGWASYKVGKYDEAEAALIKATEQLPEVQVFHYHLAKVYLAKNNYALAKQELQKTIKFEANARFEKESTLKDEATALLKSMPAAS